MRVSCLERRKGICGSLARAVKAKTLRTGLPPFLGPENSLLLRLIRRPTARMAHAAQTVWEAGGGGGLW